MCKLGCANLVDAYDTYKDWVRAKCGPGGNAMDIECVRMAALLIELKDPSTAPSVWAATVWPIRRYVEGPEWERIPQLTSISACNALGINR